MDRAGGEGREPVVPSLGNNRNSSSSFLLRVVHGAVGEGGGGGEGLVAASLHSNHNSLFGPVGCSVEGGEGGGGGDPAEEVELSSRALAPSSTPPQKPHPPDCRSLSFRSRRQVAEVCLYV